MDGGNLITKEQLIQKMKSFAEIYDIVRVVNPESTTVLLLDGAEVKSVESEPCFSVWHKEQRCSNCVSLRACMENKRITKFEFRDKEAYSVVAYPYTIQEGDRKYRVSLELVNCVESDLVLEAEAVNEQTHKIAEINRRLYEDSLTGTFNRRYYDENRFIYDMSHTMPKKIGFLVVDINNFKRVNDICGHAKGDELLAKISSELKRCLRTTDRVIRIGGDEFLIVLRDCSRLFIQKKVYQLKRAVYKISMEGFKGEHIIVSIGSAYTEEFDGSSKMIKELFDTADKEMLEDRKNPATHSSLKNILVVDDVEMNRSFIREELQNRYQIFEAANGREALKIIEYNQVDLIITDIFMDEMDGYELMRAVKSVPRLRDVPIIAITENDEASQNKAIEAGADFYIDRPFGGGYFFEIIAKLTGRDHGRKELFDMDFVLDTIPGAVIVYKIHKDHMEIVSCSRGVNQLSGWDADEFCEMDTNQNVGAVFPADLDKFLSVMERMEKTHSRGELIYRGFKKDGSIVWIWFQGRYIGEEDGCPVIEATLLDVSNNTNMYQSILDESTSAVTVVNAHTFEVLYVNRTAEELIGIKSADYIGQICYDTAFGADKPCERCISHSPEAECCEGEFERNGRYYRQIFRRIVWHGTDALLEYTIDISAEKENIAYAENQKNQQKLIIQNLPTGIIVYRLKNGELTCVEANDALCQMMHIGREKLNGCKNGDFLALAHKDDIERCKEVVDHLAKPGMDEEYEFRSLDRSSGNYVWMSGHGRSVLQPDGSVYIYLTYRDVTEKKLLEEAQSNLLAAEKSAEAKSEFYSQMSHDMRTPMNGILGITELAKQEEDIQALKDDLQKIEESGQYMLNLINDTLDYQRIESGRMHLKPDIVYAPDLVNNAVSMLTNAAAVKDVEFKIDTSKAGLDVYVYVDEMHLKQIFINLASNAIKFTPKGGTVCIVIEKLSETEDAIYDKITVSDTGIGMSRDFLENGLFRPFSQEKNSVTMQSAGSGLGLSIVKRLVEMMHGTIEVESNEGTGTTFTVYLEFDKVSEEDVRKKQNADAKKQDNHVELAGRRYLLCEDHPLNAEIVIRVLSKVNAEVEWAKDGALGLGMFKNSKEGYYDAILMDIRMPRMDGLDTTKAIRGLARKDAGTIPIIAMSANAYDEDMKKSIEAGMNRHLAKPLEVQELYHTLDSLLEKE